MSDFTLDLEAIDDRLGILPADALARLGDGDAIQAARALRRDPEAGTRARQPGMVVSLQRARGRVILPLLRRLRDGVLSPA